MCANLVPLSDVINLKATLVWQLLKAETKLLSIVPLWDGPNRKVLVSKNLGFEKVWVSKRFWCQKVLVSKSFGFEKFWLRKGLLSSTVVGIPLARFGSPSIILATLCAQGSTLNLSVSFLH